MAGSFAATFENNILNYLFKGTAFTNPGGTLYVGLFTSCTADGSTVTEVPSTNAYARVATSASSWATSTAGATSNATVITFPTATGTWGVVTHVGLYTASTGGTLVAWSDVSPSQSVVSGNTVTFAIGDIDFTLD